MRILWLVLLAGCGRLGFGLESSPPPDDPPDEDLGPTTRSLIASFSFDGTSPNDDDTGTHDAQCIGNCPAPVAGALGSAASFDGTMSCLRVPSLDAWNPTAFTFSAWISTSSDNGPLIVHEHSAACPSHAMKLSNTAVGLVQLNDLDTHNEAWVAPAIDDSWHHVAVRWDGTSQEVYLDGVCRCESKPSPRPVFALEQFTIGCYPAEGSVYSGGLDEVRVYESALTPDEIAGLFAIDGRTAPTPVACSQACAAVP